MEKLIYSIAINKPQELVFNSIIDKSVYPDWAKAWGDGMTYEGEWKKGEISHFLTIAKEGQRLFWKNSNHSIT